ncbi:Response regulator receiver domain-containing protein [Desulfonatronum zhilinae]|nr:Response regulator receiver domain-containing protein [Desulfonatronum zhilinae]
MVEGNHLNRCTVSQKTILIVDDEEEVLFSLGLVLRRAGYTVLEAGHGIEALSVMAEAVRTGQGVDLVITDLRMPYMDGPELLAAMHRRGFTSNVMVMTGYAHDVLAAEWQCTGCPKIIYKPFEAEELLREVAGALDRDPVPAGRVTIQRLEGVQ